MENLAERLRTVLVARQRKMISGGHLIPAAILLPLFRKEKEHYVLLTKRTGKVKTHKKEISFPGGVYDQEDQSLERTALRESFEEVGIREKDIEILGCLDDVETLTRYMIRPFVGVFPYPYPFVVNNEEIDLIIEVPLESLLEEGCLEMKRVSLQGDGRTIYIYRYGEHVIWGATAKILKQFLGLIREDF